MTTVNGFETDNSSDLASITDYAQLLTAIRPRAVTSQHQANSYHDAIDVLTDGTPMSEGQRDMVRLLGQLVHAWEAEHDRPLEATPAEVVASLLEENGLPQIALVPDVFANRHNVSEFLSGRRGISYERAAKLAAFFHVSPAAFFPATRAIPHHEGADGITDTVRRASTTSE